MQYDIIIIGSGAGGGTIARTLASTGLRILIIERGDYLPRERENWSEDAVWRQKRYQARETWYDKDDQPFEPYTHYCVGGNTKMYGAALLRLRERDFAQTRLASGTSPAWPIAYDDLEPFYARAERMYHVRGDAGSDPTEPRRSGPFEHPSLAPEPSIRRVYDDLRRAGYGAFPIPLGARTPANGQSPAPLGLFDGYPDPTATKADAHVDGVAPALQRENVTLLTGWKVEKLVTDASGASVRDVVVERLGERIVLKGDLVILAAGAINSAALLLRSAGDHHASGLANSSGLVGRNYMCHQNGLLIAVLPYENPAAFQKHFGIADFYHADPLRNHATEPDMPLGLIQLMGKPDAGTLEWLASLPGGEPLRAEPLESWRQRTIDFFLTSEDLPDPENRVELRADGAIRLRYTHNNTRAYERLHARCEDALRRTEALHGRAAPVFLHSRLGIGGVSHQTGTLRFGPDPRTSVLDPNCKAHDLSNLYVVDGSFFPSCGAVNPSLTIMANAIRVGEHLAGVLGAARTLEGARA
jgi:choline dehydrogenase-like flavoprotein